MKTKRLLTRAEAVRILRISRDTLRIWMECGRLPVVRRKVHLIQEFIPLTAIRDAFKVTCLNCGKVFESRRPEKALFCCEKCRNLYSYRMRVAEKKRREADAARKRKAK